MAPSGPTTHGGEPLRVAEIFRRHGAAYRRANVLGPSQARVLAALSCCRTARLGGHIEHCGACGYAHPVYDSCRDRHCPSCQAYAQHKWIAEREARVLPVPHFHVVFTLPSELRVLARSDPRFLYDLVVAAASETLMTLGRDRLGGTLGVTMVLHTWTRELLLHPHVHCIVTAGALTDDGAWSKPASRRFLFPIGVMRKLFRGIVTTRLRRQFDDRQLRVPDDLADAAAFKRLLRTVHRQDWVVYAKAPFAGAHHVFRYLGRYTHRVGLSDQRLVALSTSQVTFRTRGSGQLTVPVDEFLRRFLLHVLPNSFHKIRHFGLYSSTAVRGALPIARSVVARLPDATPPPPPLPTPARTLGPRPCPRCAGPLGRLPLDFAGDLGVTLRWPPPREPTDTS